MTLINCLETSLLIADGHAFDYLGSLVIKNIKKILTN